MVMDNHSTTKGFALQSVNQTYIVLYSQAPGIVYTLLLIPKVYRIVYSLL